LNAHPDEPTVAHLRDAGFTDAWLAAGRAECDAAHRTGCTSGGTKPEPFVGMNTRAGPGFDERIDYVMVRARSGCRLRVGASGFANQARPQPLHGMWWPSDHAGVHASLRCR
jgi:hypothetical protein